MRLGHAAGRAAGDSRAAHGEGAGRASRFSPFLPRVLLLPSPSFHPYISPILSSSVSISPLFQPSPISLCLVLLTLLSFGLSPSSLLHLSLCFTITFYIYLPFFLFILLGSRSLALLLLLPLSSSLSPPPCLSSAFPSSIFFPSLHLPFHLFIFLIRHSPLLLTLFPSVLSPPLRLPLPSFPPPGDRFRPGRTLLRLRPLPREPWPASELIGRPLALHVPLPLLGFYSVFYQHFIFLRWGRR